MDEFNDDPRRGEILEELAILMHRMQQDLIFEFNPSKNNKKLYDLYAQIINLLDECECLDC